MPFKIAEMLDIFQSEGTCPSESDLLKSSIKGFANELPSAFISFGEISSGPPGLEVFNAWSWSFTSFSVTVILSRVYGGLGSSSGRGGGLSTFEMLAKCLFSVWALSKGCISTVLLLFLKGGGGFLLFLKLEISLAILYHCLGGVFGSESVSFNFCK